MTLFITFRLHVELKMESELGDGTLDTIDFCILMPLFNSCG